jgi:Monogalactosyldiacylglycerol (MGDG) synthase
MQTIELLYFNAGGGHRAAAQALAAMAQQEARPWTLRLTNLFDVFDPKQRFQRWTGVAPEAYYNARLARGWTMGLERELKLLQAGIRWLHPQLLRRLREHWAREEPDLVMSLVPNFNRAIGESLSQTLPGVPLMTVMTDLADLPPRFWVEPSVSSHLVCGTQRAVEQARANGCDPARVHRVSGMILRPGFYDPLPFDRDAARVSVGLDTHCSTGVVMFGGHGSAEMLQVAKRLPHVPLILLCGHNQRLAERLRQLPAQAPRVVVGFSEDIPRWMRMGDFFIGKPGPGSISEALQCGLPVILTRNRKTMPQERFNTDWVQELGVGVVIKGYGELSSAVSRLQAQRGDFQQRVGLLNNSAVREVTALMAELLDRAQSGYRDPGDPRLQVLGARASQP